MSEESQKEVRNGDKPIIDDAFMARKYDELNHQYFAGLPKYKVLLKEAKVEGGKVPEGMLDPIKHCEFYPETGEIWISHMLGHQSVQGP